MSSNREKIFCADTATGILLEAVAAKAKLYSKDTTVTPETLLKEDADLTVFDLGDLLLDLFNKTHWISGHEKQIPWFAKNDCSVKELVRHMEYILSNYPEAN
ncbi:MAG: hypothetical protein H7Y86_03975 [Rhizobacter sp.]|nr:hypothetical protein [Ferruginibacter sp.]